MTSISLEPRLIGTQVRRREIRIVTAIQVALLLLMIGNLGRIPVFSTGAGARSVPLLVNDVVVVGLLFLAAAAALLHRRLRIDSLTALSMAFAALGGLTTIAGVSRFGFTTSEVLISLAFLVRWLVYFAVYVVAINFVRRTDVLAVWGALENGTLIFSAFGIFQAAFLPNFAFMVYPDATAADWDAQRHRLVSTFLDPNYAGALIMIVLLVQIAMVSSGWRVPRWKIATLAVALVVTLSRSSLLGATIGLIMIVWARGLSKRILGMAGVAMIGVVAALPALLRFARQYNKLALDDESGLSRLISWAHELVIISEHPIVGIGFNAWGPIIRQKNWIIIAASAFGQEGGLLFIAALTGFIGLALYLGMVAVMWLRSRAVARDPSRLAYERGIAVALPAITVAMIFHSLFSNSLLHPFLMEPLWVLWALGFVIAREPSTFAREQTVNAPS